MQVITFISVKIYIVIATTTTAGSWTHNKQNKSIIQGEYFLKTELYAWVRKKT